MNYDHSTIQKTAVRITAAAISEVLPGAQFLRLGESFGGFCCDFYFEGPFSSDLLILLEEKIRSWIQQSYSIDLL